MSFPAQRFETATSYASGYFGEIASALSSIDLVKVESAVEILREAICNDRLIFSCGNGGSAAIANHLVCDCGKGVRTDTDFRPRLYGLSNSAEMLTAIGNDLNFSEVFAFQLQSAARSGDVLITISSSGDSENIVQAIKWAKANQMKVISMCGFSGGRSLSLADVALHVNAHNYGIVEDVHQTLMHIMAQYLRQSGMSASLILNRQF